MINEDIFLNTKERHTAVDVVVEKIKNLLISQKLKPGDLIPSEQVIAEKVGVSRGSVREAMKILSAFGVVDVRRGNGTFISNASNKKVFDSLLFQMLVQERDYQSLIEIRSMMENAIVKLIIEKASDEELEKLNAMVTQFQKALTDPFSTERECNELDLKYHRLMGKCCHNALLDNMYCFIVELFSPTIDTRREGTGQIHRTLQDAISARDEVAALEAMDAHTYVWSRNNSGHRG